MRAGFRYFPAGTEIMLDASIYGPDDAENQKLVDSLRRLPELLKRELPSTAILVRFKLDASGLDKQAGYAVERSLRNIPYVTDIFWGKPGYDLTSFQVEVIPTDDLPDLEARLWKCIEDQGGRRAAPVP